MVVEHLGTNHADEIVSVPIPHTTIQPLTHDLIEEALSSIGVHYMRDQDGDLCTVIPGDTMACTVFCWFLIGDQFPSNFTLYCRVSPPIPQSKWKEALFACNEYSTHYRFGRFFLPFKAEQKEATLCFESQLDLSDHTTAAFLKTFILSHLANACAFLGEPHIHKRLFVTPPRNRSSKSNHKEMAHRN